jgi:hypothetical protein
MMRILDRLADTPAMVLSRYGETLMQTRPAIALLGDDAQWTGPARSMVYRWFTEPRSRLIYPAADHPWHGRIFAAQLRDAYAREGDHGRAGEIVRDLTAKSPEFTAIWAAHEVGVTYTEQKRIQHPELGVIEVHCQTLQDPDHTQTLLVFTAAPGSESHEKLQMLSAVSPF